MKKTLAFVALILLTCSLLCACGGNNNPGGTPSTPDNPSQTTFIIANYYNTDGSFSALGQALPSDPVSGDRVLNVVVGNIVVVNGKQYRVTEPTLKLYFYTQNSMAEVNTWWVEYMNSAIERNQVAEVK